MIVDLAGEARRGEVVGVYYLIRGLSVAAAPSWAGWLWTLAPVLSFSVAAVFGLASVGWYLWQGPKIVDSEQ